MAGKKYVVIVFAKTPDSYAGLSETEKAKPGKALEQTLKKHAGKVDILTALLGRARSRTRRRTRSSSKVTRRRTCTRFRKTSTRYSRNSAVCTLAGSARPYTYLSGSIRTRISPSAAASKSAPSQLPRAMREPRSDMKDQSLEVLTVSCAPLSVGVPQIAWFHLSSAGSAVIQSAPPRARQVPRTGRVRWRGPR